MKRILTLTSVAALAMGLTACAGDPYGPNNYPVSSVSTTTVVPAGSTMPVGYVEYGRVTNVSIINPGTRSAGAGGALAGAVVGGLVGNAIGAGTGRAVATVLGMVGGAAVGNRLAQNYNTTGPVYRVSVQTDQGGYREYDVSPQADLRVGDRVRIENGVIYMG